MLTRSRGLGGSPAVYGNRHLGAMTASPEAARCIPIPPGGVANTAEHPIRNGAKHLKNTNSLSPPINSSGEQVCVLDGCLVRVKYKDCPDKVSVMANVRGILLNSYKRDNIAAEDKV